MAANKKYQGWYLCVLVLSWFTICPAGGFAYTYTKVFTPPYHDGVKWSTALVPYVSWASAGVNEWSGAVATYASGWIGGGAASATQYIAFYVPAKSSIKAQAKIVYIGGTVNYGFAAFSGTQWQWNLDNGSFHKNDIEPAFTVEDIASKIISIALLGTDLIPEGPNWPRSRKCTT